MVYGCSRSKVEVVDLFGGKKFKVEIELLDFGGKKFKIEIDSLANSSMDRQSFNSLANIFLRTDIAFSGSNQLLRRMDESTATMSAVCHSINIIL